MKKLILSLTLVLALLPSFAQSPIDFFDFVNNFDWNMSTSDIQVKYKNRIIQKTDAIPYFHALPEGVLFKNITIDEFKPLTFTGYDRSTQKRVISALLDSIGTIEQLKIETEIRIKLGEPLLSVDNYDVKHFPGWETIGFEKGNVRLWMSRKLVYTLISTRNEERNICAVGCYIRDPDFRQGYWGDSMEEIKKKEGKANESNIEELYSFTTYVNGMECIATYRFTNNMLTSGKYIFLYVNSDNCVRNYKQLSDLLTAKYGAPTNDDKTSTAEEYEKNLLSEGDLISAGKLRFETTWDTPTTFLGIILYGEQFFPMLVIEYYSNLHQEERAADILKDL